jgi:hypothetical protein
MMNGIARRAVARHERHTIRTIVNGGIAESVWSASASLVAGVHSERLSEHAELCGAAGDVVGLPSSGRSRLERSSNQSRPEIGDLETSLP